MPKRVEEVKKASEKKIPVKEVIVKKTEVAKVVRKESSRRPVVQIEEPLPSRVTRSSQETNTRSERVTRRGQVTPKSRSPPVEVKAVAPK
jgi:hypothetical protein